MGWEARVAVVVALAVLGAMVATGEERGVVKAEEVAAVVRQVAGSAEEG